MSAADANDIQPVAPPRIALDAMGGDYAPEATVQGALQAVSALDCHVLLVGDPPALEAELAKHNGDASRISVVPSEGKITEDDHPAQALRTKPKASILVTNQLVKLGEADAVVSMGSTGATMASATMVLGTLPGLDRPCLGGPFLGIAPNTVVVDMGSNIDCRPSLMLGFGVMGSVFAHHYLKIEQPRVGLLSVGEEESKGNRQVREAFPLFKESNLNFVGNLEGMDFFTDKADVIVCDGFVGNVLMKFTEGLGTTLAGYLKNMLAGKLSPADLGDLAKQMWDVNNLARRMGGPLFGVQAPVVIGHGASGPEGVAGAIDTARKCVEISLVENMRAELEALEASDPAP